MAVHSVSPFESPPSRSASAPAPWSDRSFQLHDSRPASWNTSPEKLLYRWSEQDVCTDHDEEEVCTTFRAQPFSAPLHTHSAFCSSLAQDSRQHSIILLQATTCLTSPRQSTGADRRLADGTATVPFQPLWLHPSPSLASKVLTPAPVVPALSRSRNLLDRFPQKRLKVSSQSRPPVQCTPVRTAEPIGASCPAPVHAHMPATRHAPAAPRPSLEFELGDADDATGEDDSAPRRVAVSKRLQGEAARLSS